MTKADREMFEQMFKQQTASIEALKAEIEELRFQNAQLTTRVLALENQPKTSVPINGIVRDAKSGLINKLPSTAKVVKAGQRDGKWLVQIEGQEAPIEVTEWCARWWHQRIQQAAA